MNWFIGCMKKYAVFSGRARRTEYWMFELFSTIFMVAAIILDNVLGTKAKDDSGGLIYLLFALATLLPRFAVTVRRLHDIGKSGWWILINLIPLVGIFWMLFLLMTDSNPRDNEFGPNPKLAE